MSKKNKKSKSPNYTPINQHRRQGTVLTPPLGGLQQLKMASWRDDRLPEMLWAILIVGQLNQSEALAIFRPVAKFFQQFDGEKDAPCDVRLSGLAQMPPETLEAFLENLTGIKGCREILRPLLLFRDLPARDVWEKAINLEPMEGDWNVLQRAVTITLFHQSQEATDCRWVRLMCVLCAKKLILQSREQIEELIYYPDVEMQKVRPTIRALEGALDALVKADKSKEEWANKFWAQCFEDTICFPLNLSADTTVSLGTTSNRVKEVYSLLVVHTYNTQTTTTIDARHDTVFGVGLYCLSILGELLHIGMSQSITSRFALRTIVDCLISLSYLAKKDDSQLWESYRVFGAGQAKLSYLKIAEMDEIPSYVNADLLKELANEDMWDEFLAIELGHWEKSNTRKMSEDADVKNIYDRFYSWTSTFSHGHWGALRDSVFNTCGNSLHRLHRIPRESARILPDVLSDACFCIDKILETISQCYPDFPHRVTIRDVK